MLLRSKRVIFFKKGKVIFSEGNAPVGVYCISSGKVKLYKLGIEGKEQIVRMAKAGSLIGYRSLTGNDEYRTASAKTIEDSYLCYIPKETFAHLLETNAAFAFRLINILAEDIKIAQDKLTDIAQKSLKARLAETLLELKDFYGTANGEDQAINITLTREDLAGLVGTASACIIRLLSELKKQGVIGLAGKKITIKDYETLQRLANP